MGDVSQFEQELACADDHTAHWRELIEKLDSSTVKIPDKLRLGLLYALRYETSGNINMVQQAMKKGGVPPDMVNLVSVMLRYGGSKSRGLGLYGDQNNIMSNLTKSFMTSVQGVSPETVIPDEIIVFIVGGVTYEEGTKVSEFNETNRGKIQVILGGSTVHNSTSFLEELKMT